MIELHPEGAGHPIVGDWKGSSALYLVGGSNGFRWSDRITPGDMPIAVACRGARGISIAPVHPMCHVSAKGQAVAQIASGGTIQLGTDKFQFTVSNVAQSKILNRRHLMTAVFVISALIGGWLLHGLLSVSSSAVAATDVYTF